MTNRGRGILMNKEEHHRRIEELSKRFGHGHYQREIYLHKEVISWMVRFDGKQKVATALAEDYMKLLKENERLREELQDMWNAEVEREELDNMG